MMRVSPTGTTTVSLGTDPQTSRQKKGNEHTPFTCWSKSHRPSPETPS